MGYIAYPFDLGAGSNSTDLIFAKVLSVSDGHIPILQKDIHNGMVCVSLFDFSNHDRGTKKILDEIYEYILSMNSDEVMIHIDYNNMESGVGNTYVLNIPG